MRVSSGRDIASVTDTSEIVMFEVAELVEVKTDQDCDDLRIGHRTFSSPFWSVSSGVEGIFCHLNLKFFAKIIGDTK